MEIIISRAGSGDGRRAIDKRSVAASFGRAAASYDAHAVLQRSVADRLLERLAPSTAPLRILDLGSGTGYCTGKLRALFPAAELVALDLSSAMLRHARGLNRDIGAAAACGDAEALPFAAASFDMVFSSLTMQWCGESRLFAEARRVARPGGRCCLSTFGPDTLVELKAAWAEVDDYVHVNEFSSPAELDEGLREAGFARRCLWQERRRRFYRDLRELGGELKAIGAHNMNSGQARGLTGPRRLQRLQQSFERGRVSGRGIPVTWQVLYLDLTV